VLASNYSDLAVKVASDAIGTHKMNLHQLVYYSRNTVAGDDRALLNQLRKIVSVSQRNNQRDGITGYLIFDKTWFLQVLEGEHSAIFTTYRRIEQDARHGSVTLMQTRPIPARQFGNWTMGGSMFSLEVQEIYLRHGIGGTIDPTKLKGAAILDLALDLQAHEAAKRANIRAAS
jgi:hypothetical protein